MNVKPILGVVMGITLVTTLSVTSTPFLQPQTSEAYDSMSDYRTVRKAPIASFGENVYMAWSTNNTANRNEEVMFRTSTDGGTTFGDKINLSNTTNADSTRVEIDEEGDRVYVSWWETNQTHDTPMTRISTDAGQTFGPVLVLAANGTIGAEEEEGE